MEETVKSLSISDDTYVLVAAIDFGTTFSGYAFTFRNEVEEKSGDDMKIIMNKNWGLAQGFQSYKTPTSLLVNDARELIAFGYEAEHKYAAAGDDDRIHLFRHFKMSLFREQGDQKLRKNIKIQALDGMYCRALTVFSLALGYLRDHLLKAVLLSSGKDIDPFMVKWVLTVPAIWKDEAKQFMRQAAYEAGLIQSVDSRKIQIALEPEGASIECRSIDMTEFKSQDHDLTSFKKLAHKAGTRYLVVDAGGGTVDITGHEILDNDDVKEVIPPSGGDWGGTNVDENFINLLRDVLGTEFINKFKKEFPNDWLQLMMAFQTVKCANAGETEAVRVQLPTWNLSELARDVHGKRLDVVINSQNKRGVKFNNGFLVLTQKELKALFQPILKKIVSHVCNLLQQPEMSECAFIFLVGGFGNSGMLHAALSDAVKLPVLVPPDAQMSVLKGAVRFGTNTTVIRSRIVRKTYGTHTSETDIQPHYKRDSIHETDGVTFATNVFNKLVDKGESVEIGSTRSIDGLAPLYDAHRSFDVAIFSSDKLSSEIVHSDEEGVDLLGSVHVEVTRTDVPVHERLINLEFTFGGTEIYVKATEALSGLVYETSVDCLEN